MGIAEKRNLRNFGIDSRRFASAKEESIFG